MNMINDNKKTRISSLRIYQLQKQFEYNYNNLARTFFNKLDDTTKIGLLNDEFQYDKYYLLALKPDNKQNIFIRKHIDYFYTPSFSHLNDKNTQTHLRHNLYRTISAILLKDCSLEERIIILGRNTEPKSKNNKRSLEFIKHRLENIYSKLDNHTISINI